MKNPPFSSIAICDSFPIPYGIPCCDCPSVIANPIGGRPDLIMLLLIKLICTWQQPKLGFIKYYAHTTCLAYFHFFFSIDNSEEMWLEK